MKRQKRVSDQEIQLQELVFGKDIVENLTEVRPSKQSNKVVELESVWHDAEDEEVEIDLQATDRLRKLNKSGKSGKVNATEFSSLLKERFQTREMAWAKADESPEDINILQQTGTMLKSRRNNLSSGRINISRLVDANISEPSKGAISAVRFHHTGRAVMAAGQDRSIRFFNIDGEKNEKLLTVKFGDTEIHAADFVGKSDEVVLSGRKPFFYSYDTTTGCSTKIGGLAVSKGLKSHENMTVSSEGSKIAFEGAGGFVHILSGRSKTWIMDLKMNTSVRSASFLTEEVLVTSGLDADVYVWDLRHTGRCLSRFHHEDGMCTSALATFARTDSSNESHSFALGSESGVVSMYDCNMTNIQQQIPRASKSLMNLTTPISLLRYHPTGEVMAMASKDKIDQLKLVHVPTSTIFGNWPTERTPIRKVTALDFSPNGGYMIFGNNKGRVLLYRLKNFDCV